MCNCSKPISQTDCQKLIECNRDPEKRLFIYHIFDDKRGLKIACVSDRNPNDVAIERGFVDENGQPEWFTTREHPCLYPI